LIPEYKFFIFNKSKCSGIFLSLYGKYIRKLCYYYLIDNSQNKYISTEYIENGIAGGFSCGYQNYFLKKRLAVEIIAGIGKAKAYKKKYIIPQNVPNDTDEWPDYRLAINVGWRF